MLRQQRLRMGLLLFCFKWIMISIEHAFVFVNRNTEQMFDISRKFILLMLSDHVLIMCKSYFPITLNILVR